MTEPARFIYDSINNLADLDNLLKYQVENLYIDFKTKRFHDNSDIDEDLQKNLSKGISGFANSDGGVLIIGVDAPQNLPPKLKPIADIYTLEQSINSYIPRSTAFLARGVEVKSILTEDDYGVVLIYIPKSEQAPHCSNKDKKYYQRVGDSFVAMEHYQLADMFGKRSHPFLIVTATLKADINHRGQINLQLNIKNEGRAIAKHILLRLENLAGFKVNRFGISGNGHFGLNPFPGPTNFDQYLGSADIVIHPKSFLEVTRLEFQCSIETATGRVMDPSDEIIISGYIAADEFSLRRWKIRIPHQSIQNNIADPRNQSSTLVSEFID